MSRDRGGPGKGRGRGRGREGYPIGTSAYALAFAHSLLDDRSEPATAKVLLLSWVPAWKQLAPHGPPTRREGEVRRCGALNVTFSARRELLRHGGFDAIAIKTPNSGSLMAPMPVSAACGSKAPPLIVYSIGQSSRVPGAPEACL